MNPNNPHWNMSNYPLYFPHMNPATFHWNQNLQWSLPSSSTEAAARPGPSAIRGNFVHVNPAFFQPNLPPPNELSNPKRIIVNPKFFPHIQNEMTTPVSTTQDILNVERIPLAQNVQLSNLKTIKMANQPKIKSITQPTSNLKIENKALKSVLHLKPSPIRPHVGDRSKLTKLNFSNSPGRSKYKWRKMETPLKAATIKHAYKLVRKAPGTKLPKMASMLTLHAHDFKMLTPPKLTSTPIEAQSSNSRFKLDNRVRNKRKLIKSSSPRASLPKIIHNNYQLIRNKCWKPNVNLAKFAVNRSTVNRSFTNFKSPLCRPLVHRGSRLQRLVNAVKPNKSTKKVKTTKNKTRKRYYDDEAKAKVDDEVLDDTEIAEKPSGPKIRTPLGALPSFITL